MFGRNDNIIYRRGVILGLTMAEIVILIIFCLLLLLNSIVAKKNHEIANIKNELKVKEDIAASFADPDKTRNKLELLLSELDKNNFDDAFKELKLIKEKIKQAEKLITTLQEKDKALTIDSVIKKIDELEHFKDEIKTYDVYKKFFEKNPNRSIDELHQSLTLIEELKKNLPEIKDAPKQSEAITTFIEKTLRDNKTLTGQISYLQKKFEQAGRGTEMPACWATPDGKPEYIFDIALTSDGIILHDNKLSHRTEDQEELPTENITFDKEVSIDKFRLSTDPIYSWSLEKKCRFFVKVYDLTTSDEKSIYKKHLRVAGEHFYYFEPLSEKPSWLGAKNIASQNSNIFHSTGI